MESHAHIRMSLFTIFSSTTLMSNCIGSASSFKAPAVGRTIRERSPTPQSRTCVCSGSGRTFKAHRTLLVRISIAYISVPAVPAHTGTAYASDEFEIEFIGLVILANTKGRYSVTRSNPSSEPACSTTDAKERRGCLQISRLCSSRNFNMYRVWMFFQCTKRANLFFFQLFGIVDATKHQNLRFQFVDDVSVVLPRRQRSLICTMPRLKKKKERFNYCLATLWPIKQTNIITKINEPTIMDQHLLAIFISSYQSTISGTRHHCSPCWCGL